MGCARTKPIRSPEESREMVWRARVENMYREYNPEKMNEVPDILAKCKGKEHSLMRKLIKKYGPEPDSRLKRKPGERRMDPDDIPKDIRYIAHKELQQKLAEQEAEKKRKEEEEKKQLFKKTPAAYELTAPDTDPKVHSRLSDSHRSMDKRESSVNQPAMASSHRSEGSTVPAQMAHSGVHTSEGTKTATPPHALPDADDDSDSDLGIDL